MKVIVHLFTTPVTVTALSREIQNSTLYCFCPVNKRNYIVFPKKWVTLKTAGYQIIKKLEFLSSSITTKYCHLCWHNVSIFLTLIHRAGIPPMSQKVADVHGTDVLLFGIVMFYIVNDRWQDWRCWWGVWWPWVV